ncbi:MAG: sensor histidine kinase [Planctomycetota bacterium]
MNRAPIYDAVKNGVGILEYDERAKVVEFLAELDRELDPELDPELPLTEGVTDELSQLFMNLGLYAIDALQGMPDGHPGTVRFRTARIDRDRAPTLRVEVEDNGPGMTPEVAARRSSRRSYPGQGTGLGLAVSLRIVEKHGGRFEIDPEKDRGTLFVIELRSSLRPAERIRPVPASPRGPGKAICSRLL